MRGNKDLYKAVATKMERRDAEEVGLSWFGNRLEGKGAKIKGLCVFIYKAPRVLTPRPSTLLWPILTPTTLSLVQAP